jgi:CRP-like cAMP-binding protein
MDLAGLSPADCEKLSTTPLFHGLCPAEIDSVTRLLTYIELPSGWLLITRDQRPSTYVYLLLSGAAKVQIEQDDGSVAIVAILGPQQIVGELSQADGLSCSATVETIERTKLLRLAAADFHDLTRRIPRLSDNLRHILSARLRIANQQILALVTLDATRRVAAQIHALAQAYGAQADGACHIPFRLTQSTLAAMTGISRVRVNRIIQGLIDQRVIALTPQYHIDILDSAALAACAMPKPHMPSRARRTATARSQAQAAD